ncbi:MAG: substrate-binding domain-containing protein [Spirochaetales bacterium]|nr:substrate-binding domain-containing protein [Spirochaetales bacterium]
MELKNAHRHVRIALFTDWIEGPYHLSLISGIKAEAERYNADVYIFVGGCIDSPELQQSQRNIIYQFISRDCIDGMIIISGSIGRYTRYEVMSTFLSQYSEYPRVCIAQEFPSIPSVIPENKKGMKELMTHLIKDHNYRNIAFIGGPEENQEAMERLDGYKETLLECGLTFNPSLVTCGQFISQSGTLGVREFIDNRHVVFDALVCVSDETASGAYKELIDRGINIPRDIAVTGFDNHEFYKYLTPSLSTVRQPLGEIGKKAVELVFSLIQGKDVPLRNYLPTEFIKRESCGCSLEENNNMYNKVCGLQKGEPEKRIRGIDTSLIPEKTHDNDFRLMCEHIQNEIKMKIASAYCYETDIITFQEVEYLMDTFLRHVEKNESVQLKRILDPFFLRWSGCNLEPTYWLIIFLECKTSLLSLTQISGGQQKIEELFRLIHYFMMEYIDRNHGEYRLYVEREIISFRYFAEMMMIETKIENIFNLLRQDFSFVGIKSLYILKYTKIIPDDLGNTMVELLFAYKNNEQIVINRDNQFYKANKLISEDLFITENGHSLSIIEPLFIGNDHYGFALFNVSIHSDLLGEIMQRTFLIAVVRITLFIHQLQNQSGQLQNRADELAAANKLMNMSLLERDKARMEIQKLNDELEGRVKQRTAELHKANNELKNTLAELRMTQNELIQSEKMAALGGLVAGISHEINTPIGITLTSSTYLEDITNELYMLYMSEKLTRRDMENYLANALESARLIKEHTLRATELIGSFKKVVVDQSGEERRHFIVREYIDDILVSLGPKLKQVKHKITVSCPKDLWLYSYPGTFSIIITHLIFNSIFHAFAAGEAGSIILDIHVHENTLVFIYSDNGKGIDKKHIDKIFNPFFTTVRNEGRIGLGLHIVYNLVTRTLKGKIECTSKIREGTKFVITFPMD